jgi:hypothetical protein
MAALVAFVALGITRGHPLSALAALVFVTLAVWGFHARRRIEARVREIFTAARARGALPGIHALHEAEVDELDRFAASEGFPRGALRETFLGFARRNGGPRG